MMTLRISVSGPSRPLCTTNDSKATAYQNFLAWDSLESSDAESLNMLHFSDYSRELAVLESAEVLGLLRPENRTAYRAKISTRNSDVQSHTLKGRNESLRAENQAADALAAGCLGYA